MAWRTEVNKSFRISLLSLALALFLAACSFPASPPEQSPEPVYTAVPSSSAAPSLAPTPEPTPAPTVWTITDESSGEILALADIPSLKRIDAGACREYAALLELRSLLPDCQIHWQVPLQGELFSDETRELCLSSTDGLEEALPGLPELVFVDLLSCEPDLDLMRRLYAQYPGVDFLFSFTVGREGHRQWQLRSDCTCFSSLWSGSEPYRYTEEDYEPLLRFCRHLRALDLGHSDIQDVSLIGQLSELQVLILADNPRITDISPLRDLHELMYIELFECYDIEDFSCFFHMPHMVDMNLSYCENLEDISFLDGMADFQSGWFRNTKVTEAMLKPYRESREGLRFVVGSPEDWSSIVYGWRNTDRCRAIRHAFSHWQEVEDFRSWDEIVYH